jgi:replicative DNA helicase
VSTAKLIELLGRKRYQGRLWVETFAGEFGTDADLPLDPWLLGALLGDGSLGGTSLRFSTGDAEMLGRVEVAVGADMAVTHAGNYDYRIVQRGGARRKGPRASRPTRSRRP